MPDCFVIMPITTPANCLPDYGHDPAHFAHVYEHLFAPAIQRIDYTPIPPSATGSDVIPAEIIRRLATSDLALCDMSTLNPNVFFELGIRMAVDRPVALVKDQRPDPVPFDLALVNSYQYDHALSLWNNERQVDALASHLQEVVDRCSGRNSLWGYFGLAARAFLGEKEPSAPTGAQLDVTLLPSGGRQKVSKSDRAAPFNLNPAMTRTQEELGKRIEDFLYRAQAIASEVNARFNVTEITGARVVLDIGDFSVDEARRFCIIRMGRRLGLVVAIPAGDGPQSHEPRPVRQPGPGSDAGRSLGHGLGG